MNFISICDMITYKKTSKIEVLNMSYSKLEIETTFKDGNAIPIEHTGYGENISPEFRIKNLSSNAKSLVVILEDISHPIKNFTHWIAWNIKAESIIPANVGNMKNVIQGIAYGFHKYAGAKPPKFQKHNYRYTIYSLDDTLNLSPNTMKKKLLKTIDGHILQKGTITGSFKK